MPPSLVEAIGGVEELPSLPRSLPWRRRIRVQGYAGLGLAGDGLFADLGLSVHVGLVRLVSLAATMGVSRGLGREDVSISLQNSPSAYDVSMRGQRRRTGLLVGGVLRLFLGRSRVFVGAGGTVAAEYRDFTNALIAYHVHGYLSEQQTVLPSSYSLWRLKAAFVGQLGVQLGSDRSFELTSHARVRPGSTEFGILIGVPFWVDR